MLSKFVDWTINCDKSLSHEMVHLVNRDFLESNYFCNLYTYMWVSVVTWEIDWKIIFVLWKVALGWRDDGLTNVLIPCLDASVLRPMGVTRTFLSHNQYEKAQLSHIVVSSRNPTFIGQHNNSLCSFSTKATVILMWRYGVAQVTRLKLLKDSGTIFFHPMG